MPVELSLTISLRLIVKTLICTGSFATYNQSLLFQTINVVLELVNFLTNYLHLLVELLYRLMLSIAGSTCHDHSACKHCTYESFLKHLFLLVATECRRIYFTTKT